MTSDLSNNNHKQEENNQVEEGELSLLEVISDGNSLTLELDSEHEEGEISSTDDEQGGGYQYENEYNPNGESKQYIPFGKM